MPIVAGCGGARIAVVDVHVLHAARGMQDNIATESELWGGALRWMSVST